MADKGYLVLARKWRPQRFEDVVGQEHITRTLKNAIASGRIHHAFLFIGSRGIGKTTSARILAKALNCLSFDAPTPEPCGACENCVSISAGTNIDVLEIDGASNNGVDDVREIRENIRMVPSNGRYKVYIIDEVHQLSTGAFNALLKTLEEPPPHAIFVLATTESHKIPATVISRCQRYDFRRVAIAEIVQLLRSILNEEGIQATDEALYAIARSAEGGVRDAESILDELITYCEGEITFEAVFDVLGLVDWKVLHALCEAILAKDVGSQLNVIEDVVAAGKDLTQFVQDILRYFRNLLVAKTSGNPALLQLPEEEQREVAQRAQQFSTTHLIRLVEQFADLTNSFDSQLAQRIALEALLIKISKVGIELSLDTVLEKLLLLEGAAPAQGAQTAAAPPPAPPPPAPNPPPAGPADTARAAPASPRRVTVTPRNLRQVWEEVVEHITETSLSHRIWLGQATPALSEDGALLLRFDAESAQARNFIEEPENRRILTEALEALTENLGAFKTALVDNGAPASPAPAPANAAAAAAATHHVGAAPEDIERAMEDPGIARVLDVFKGRIVRITSGAEEDAAP